jgi:hypothetical protein
MRLFMGGPGQATRWDKGPVEIRRLEWGAVSGAIVRGPACIARDVAPMPTGKVHVGHAPPCSVGAPGSLPAKPLPDVFYCAVTDGSLSPGNHAPYNPPRPKRRFAQVWRRSARAE